MIESEKGNMSNTMYIKHEVKNLEAKLPSSNSVNSVGKVKEKESYVSVVELKNQSNLNGSSMTTPQMNALRAK